MVAKTTKKASAPQSVTAESVERVTKKSVVRFNFPDGSPVSTIYLDNDADKALGSPDAISLTIEAA